MNIDELLNKLKTKFNYTKELIEYLSNAIPVIINYFGEEYTETITDTLLNCEIHIQNKNESTDDYLHNYFNVGGHFNIYDNGHAVYYSVPYINNNELIKKDLIYIPTKDITGRYEKYNIYEGTNENRLIHELCHAIKGHNKVYYDKENNTVVTNAGIIKDIYEIRQNNRLSLIATENLGIGEGLNSYDEMKILSIIIGKEQYPIGYSDLVYEVINLSNNEDFMQAAKETEFNNPNALIDYLGNEKYNALIEAFDEVHKFADDHYFKSHSKKEWNDSINKLGVITDSIAYQRGR